MIENQPIAKWSTWWMQFECLASSNCWDDCELFQAWRIHAIHSFSQRIWDASSWSCWYYITRFRQHMGSTPGCNLPSSTTNTDCYNFQGTNRHFQNQSKQHMGASTHSTHHSKWGEFVEFFESWRSIGNKQQNWWRNRGIRQTETR